MTTPQKDMDLEGTGNLIKTGAWTGAMVWEVAGLRRFIGDQYMSLNPFFIGVFWINALVLVTGGIFIVQAAPLFFALQAALFVGGVARYVSRWQWVKNLTHQENIEEVHGYSCGTVWGFYDRILPWSMEISHIQAYLEPGVLVLVGLAAMFTGIDPLFGFSALAGAFCLLFIGRTRIKYQSDEEKERRNTRIELANMQRLENQQQVSQGMGESGNSASREPTGPTRRKTRREA